MNKLRVSLSPEYFEFGSTVELFLIIYANSLFVMTDYEFRKRGAILAWLVDLVMFVRDSGSCLIAFAFTIGIKEVFSRSEKISFITAFVSGRAKSFTINSSYYIFTFNVSLNRTFASLAFFAKTWPNFYSFLFSNCVRLSSLTRTSS